MFETVPDPGFPRIGDPAPDFDVETTHGRRRLEDYAGSWLVLFSHPADFTPVCTSEFVAFAEHHAAFEELDCALLGLSVDSIYAHIAWVRSIEQNFAVSVPFPIIADGQMKVSRAWGMVHENESDTTAVRATFVIDPDGFVRTILYYPMSTGRSVPEILRVVEALQTSAKHRVATPEGWKRGGKVLKPAPSTVEQADERGLPNKDLVDWYFERTRIPLD